MAGSPGPFYRLTGTWINGANYKAWGMTLLCHQTVTVEHVALSEGRLKADKYDLCT